MGSLVSSVVAIVVTGLLGVVLGLLISILGGGGAIFLVPILVYGFGLGAAEAAGTALTAVCASAIVGAVGHYRRGFVRASVVLRFGLSSMAGSVAGSALHKLLSDQVTMLIFAALLLVAAYRMAFGKTPSGKEGDKRVGTLGLVLMGFGLGVIGGLLGVGGGFLMVPLLMFGAGLTVQESIGTSIAVILMSSATGIVSYAALGKIDVAFTAPIGVGALAGAIAGTPLSGKIPDRILKRAFTGLLLVTALYVLLRSLG